MLRSSNLEIFFIFLHKMSVFPSTKAHCVSFAATGAERQRLFSCWPRKKAGPSIIVGLPGQLLRLIWPRAASAACRTHPNLTPPTRQSFEK